MRIQTMALLALSSFLLLPVASPATENDTSTVRLCVALPVNHSFLNTGTVISQNRLVHDINEATQKKKAKVRVEAIPVEDANLGDAEAESRDKECTYLLVTEFTDWDTLLPGTANPTELPPPILRGRTSEPRAGLHFRIARVGSATTIDRGNLGPAVGVDGDSAALDLLYQLSVRAVHSVLKSRPPKVDLAARVE